MEVPPLVLVAMGTDGTRPPSEFISHEVFFKSFCKSQFPHKSVNLFFILVIVKDRLTDLWGS